MDAEKKSLGASERDEAARYAFREQVAPEPVARCVIVDECGSNINLTPRYAYAPRGERAYGQAPRNTEKNTTVIAAMTIDGMGPALLLEGATDGDAFVAYVEHVLAPRLVPGQIVVLDNLAAHKRQRVREVIEGRECQLWFLPAYSPDLSPIEEAFSKLKHLLRRAEARTRQALEQAIAEALRQITPEDAKAFITHLGYGAKAQ